MGLPRDAGAGLFFCLSWSLVEGGWHNSLAQKQFSLLALP
jgi:hypothetical protein